MNGLALQASAPQERVVELDEAALEQMAVQCLEMGKDPGFFIRTLGAMNDLGQRLEEARSNPNAGLCAQFLTRSFTDGGAPQIHAPGLAAKPTAGPGGH